jgi:hypothetical protein
LLESGSFRNVLGAFNLLSISTLSMAALLYLFNSQTFRIFFGDNNPFIILISLSILGLLLARKFGELGFEIYCQENLKLRYRYFAFAVLLAMIIISIDLYVVFPGDMNVIFPYSVLYYPVFGYVVEILFHMTPLFLLLFIAKRLFNNTNNIIIPGIIFFVSLLEPFFQVSLGFSSSVPTWTMCYVGVHIFLINIIQLMLFWRFDFVSMYSFRMLYYLFWHIIWGYLRLHILF